MKTCHTSPVLFSHGSNGISATGPTCPCRDRTRWTRSACRANTAKFTPPGRTVAPKGAPCPRETVRLVSGSAWTCSSIIFVRMLVFTRMLLVSGWCGPAGESARLLPNKVRGQFLNSVAEHLVVPLQLLDLGEKERVEGVQFANLFFSASGRPRAPP